MRFGTFFKNRVIVAQLGALVDARTPPSEQSHSRPVATMFRVALHLSIQGGIMVYSTHRQHRGRCTSVPRVILYGLRYNTVCLALMFQEDTIFSIREQINTPGKRHGLRALKLCSGDQKYHSPRVP